MKTNVLKPKSLAFTFLTKVPYEAEAGKDGVHGEDGLQWYTCFVNKLEDQKHWGRGAIQSVYNRYDQRLIVRKEASDLHVRNQETNPTFLLCFVEILKKAYLEI